MVDRTIASGGAMGARHRLKNRIAGDHPMEILIHSSYDELSKAAAQVVADMVNNKPDAVLVTRWSV